MNHFKEIAGHIRLAPISLILSALALVLFGMPELGRHVEFRFADFHLPDLKRLSSREILYGASLLEWSEFIRLVGCNWLHWSTDHLFWDLGMFYVVGSLCERRYPMAFIWTIVLGAFLIPISVLVDSPDLQSYRGLSGIDTALFALLSTAWLFEEVRQRNWSRSLLFLGLLFGMSAKIAFEMTAQQTLFVSDNSFTPVPTAHLVGAIIGVVCTLLTVRRTNRTAHLDPEFRDPFQSLS